MIPQSEFHHALAVALHAVPDDKPTMPALQCVLIEFITDREMRMVGTDGERIVVCSLVLDHLQPAGSSFRLAPQAARDMLCDLPVPLCADSTNRVTLCVFGDTLCASAGEACATAERLADGLEYPAYRKVLTHNTRPAVPRPFDRRYLAEALVALEPLAVSVMIDINGLRGPGYIDAVLRGGLECIAAVRVGISEQIPTAVVG